VERGALPKERTSFTGRERELEQLQSLLSSGAQLVVIKGGAGTGKTRLACHFARQEQREHRPRGGVWFCDLSRANTADDLCVAVASEIGLQIPDLSANALARALARRKELVLVLDNFEQLDSEACKVLDAWVEGTDLATFLVTSRRRLNLPGEQVLELGPLPYPRSGIEPSGLLEFPAVRLFVDRARLARPGYLAEDGAELGRVAKIVRSLEGLPLAIELCAARMKLLGSEQVLSRLEEGRALRGALDGSWELLDLGARRALATISIFVGGFELEAARAALASDSEASVLDVLELLVDHSLLSTEDAQGLAGERRFVLSEAVREYARERLEAEPDLATEVAIRHARFFAAHCEKLSRRSESSRLALEIDNALAAIDRLARSGAEGDLELALGLALVVEPALYTGPIARQIAVLGRALDPILVDPGRAESLPLPVQALVSQCLVARGWSLIMAGEAEKGGRDLDLAVSLATTTGARLRALARRGVACLIFHERERGLTCLEAALEDLPKIGPSERDRHALADYHTDLGVFRQQEANFVEARSELEQALALWRSLGSRRNEGLALANLGDCALESGAIDEALRYYERAVKAFSDVGDRRLEGNVLSNSGAALIERGAFDEAKSALGRALGVHRELGYRYYEAITLAYFAYASLASDSPVEARDYASAALELFEDRRCSALTRAVLAVALFETGEAEPALRELEVAERELSETGRGADPVYAGLMRAWAELVRERSTESRRQALEALSEAERAGASYDVRFAAKNLKRVLSRVAPAPIAPASARSSPVSSDLVIGPEGRWFRWQGQSVEFRRQAALRAILETLAKKRIENAGRPLALEALFESGWPGESIASDSQRNRLYVAMSQLRKLGLKGLIVSRDDGWLLDPSVNVVFSNESAP
jgi:tetratricopeptide (TPR) repeat protein